VALNPKEHDLLELLLSRPGHLFSREEIVERVWRQRYTPASRVGCPRTVCGSRGSTLRWSCRRYAVSDIAHASVRIRLHRGD
jgi:hypothetical protein